MASDIGAVASFDCKSDIGNIGQRWKRWVRSFTFFMDARGDANAQKKKSLLLHCAGEDVQDIFETLTVPARPSDETPVDVFEQALQMLNQHFAPQVNYTFERHIFRKIEQKENETVDQYVIRLKQQASMCNFMNADEEILTQIIDKCRSS